MTNHGNTLKLAYAILLILADALQDLLEVLAHEAPL